MLSLDQFLNQIGQAAIDTAQACAHQQTNRLLEHLNQDGSPKTITVRLAEGGPPVEIPRLTLMPQSGMLPEELEIELESDVLLPTDQDSVDKSVSLTFRNTGDGTQASHMRVRIKMRRKNSPESIELLRDRMVAQVSDELHKSNSLKEDQNG